MGGLTAAGCAVERYKDIQVNEGLFLELMRPCDKRESLVGSCRMGGILRYTHSRSFGHSTIEETHFNSVQSVHSNQGALEKLAGSACDNQEPRN